MPVLRFAVAAAMAAAALFVQGAAEPARAASVTYNFAGTVTFVDSQLNPVAVGDLLSGSMTIDTAVSPVFGSNSGSAIFQGAVVSQSVTIGSRSGSGPIFSQIFTFNQSVFGPPIWDRFDTFTGFSGPAVDALNSPGRFDLLLETFVNDSAVADALVIPTPASLADFEIAQFSGLFEGFPESGGFLRSGFAGTLTQFEVAPVSEVPLPGALPLFASGLAGLSYAAWRRRRTAAAEQA